MSNNSASVYVCVSKAGVRGCERKVGGGITEMVLLVDVTSHCKSPPLFVAIVI